MRLGCPTAVRPGPVITLYEFKPGEWYFKGYKDGVNVFLEEFWDRIQREDGWKENRAA